MSQKRPFDEVDTDYQEFDFLTGHQSKRQKLLEHDAKEATIKKIETIIRREFARELCNKEAEIELIDERINEGRRLLDRLRACIVAQHYSKVLPTAGPSSSASALSESQSSVIHPAVKKFIGKTICSSRSTHGRPSLSAFVASQDVKSQSIENSSRLKQAVQSNASVNSQVNRSQSGGAVPSEQCRGDRFKLVKKLIVGNVSKYLAPDKKEANDKSTHKWMVYVRGPKEEPPIDEFVEKVCFFLHDSYFPNNVVKITQPPFHLTRRGWGEFQVRVQLHCKGPSRKIFNINHQLKLDRTYTGLQTMGAETVVEIKLDKEITDSRLSRVLQDPCYSPPRHEAETVEQLPQLQIKEEKDDDGYEDLTATELAPKSRDAFQGLAASSQTICNPSLAFAQQTKRKNTKQSVSNGFSISEASLGDLQHSDVFSNISEMESMPFTSGASAGLDQVQPTVCESSFQHEISRTVDDRKSGSSSFLLESETHKLTGFPVNPVCSLESFGVDVVPVECSNICRRPGDHDNVQEEVVVGELVSAESASIDSVCMEPESCDNVLEETVTSDNTCIEPDYLFAKSRGFYDTHNGGIYMEQGSLSVELEGCDNVHEEVVISDTICVEPTSGDNVREESDHSCNTQSSHNLTDGTSFESASCGVVYGEPSGLVSDMETEPPGVYISRTPRTCDDVLDVEPDVSVGNCVEPAVNAEPSARMLDLCSTSDAKQVMSTVAVEVPAQIKETEEKDFLRCVDSSGRVFRIPRHLVQSNSANKTNAVIEVNPVAQATKTCATNKLNSSVEIGTPERLVALSQMVATSTAMLPQTSATSQISTTNNRFATCENTTVNRVTLKSTGLQNVVNVATKEVCVVGRGGKSGGVLAATTIVGPRTSKAQGIIRGESDDSIVVVPCTSLGSFPTKNSMILPVQRNGDPKTLMLVMPGGVQGVAPFRVVTQNQSTKLGSALPSMRMTAVQSDLPKTVVVRSVGLGPNQSQVVLGNVRPANLVRTSGGGTVTFVATKRPRGVAPISSVRVLSPRISTCVAASPVLPSPVGSVTRLLHSQVRPVTRSLPSQLGPVVRSLPSLVSPVVRSLPSRVSPGVRSLPSHVSPVVRSLPSQVIPVVRPLSSQASPVQRSVQQNCSTSQPKVDSPPVFLLVPSEVKGRQVVVTGNSPQPAVRHVLYVPKGTNISSSGLNLTSQLKTRNVASVQPMKLLSGITGNQDVALTSASTSIRLATDNSGKSKAVSILRPPAPPSSSMTSLLKKNLFVQSAVPVSLAQGEGQHPRTATSSNNIPPSTKSSTGKSIIPMCPSSLVCTAQTLLRTQIGNQTVIVKLDSSEKFGHAQSKKNEELKLNDPCLSTPSVTTQENRLPVVRLREKHLIFKTLRESSQKKPPVDVTANINLQDLESMEDLVRSLARHYPVYGDGVDRSVHPYCATSWNSFLQWNIGKRRAAELCRAIAIQRKMCLLLNGVDTFRGEAIWSKQQIIKWCRHRLYTPLDNEMAVHLRENQVEKLLDPSDAFSSLTDHKEVLTRLDTMSRMLSTMQDNENNDDDDDIELDIVTIEKSPEKETKVKRSPVEVLTGAEVIPPSVEAQFVHEAAAKIGIRLSPGPVLPDECPDVLSSTVEEMIAAATRAFANELIRTAAAKLFDSGRNPLQLDVASICEAIRQTSRYDFLTNHLLGVQEEGMNPS